MRRILQSHSAICKINLQKKASWIKLKIVSAFFIRWMVTTIAVFVAERILPGIKCSGVEALLGASLLLGIINAFVRPFLLLLSLPFIIITMGLFIFVVNALLLLFVSQIIPPFHVDGFWNALFGAIIISMVSWILSSFFRTSDGRIHAITHHPSIKKADARTIK
jgi:putative membrane protein